MARVISILFASTVICLATGADVMASSFSALDALLAKKNVVRKRVHHGSEIERGIRKVFGPNHDDTAICIAVSESAGPVDGRVWRPGMRVRFNTKAWSKTGDHGLFQANYYAHHSRGETENEFHKRMSNPWYNINWAYRLSREGRDFHAWTGTYGRGLCRGLS